MLLALGIMTVGQVVPQPREATARAVAAMLRAHHVRQFWVATPQQGIIVRRLCRCGKEVST